MAPKLYKADASPPARATMMACELFNVPVEMVDVDLPANKQFDPEYIKKNPLHAVPVLEDGDLVIHDSHAILIYLAEIYGKKDDFYPKDVKQRALINQILFFEAGNLIQSLRAISYPAFVHGERKITQKKLDRIAESYGFVEKFLTRSEYIATNKLTIADLSIVATLTSLFIILPLDPEKYPKTQAWVKKMEKYDFYQKQHVPGLAVYSGLLHHMLDF